VHDAVLAPKSGNSRFYTKALSVLNYKTVGYRRSSSGRKLNTAALIWNSSGAIKN
jgi:hypothetical protein